MTSIFSSGSLSNVTSGNVVVNPGSFVKLQLLVPGESAAPGTASGKVGQPSPAASGTAFTVTVNAVDANWNLLTNVSDTLAITASDTNATLPGSAALLGGTQTFSLTLKASGSATVTASDVTDNTKASSTSPSITVNPGPFSKLQLLVPGETAVPGTATAN